MVYPEASYIIREGEPHDMILFIVQGLVRVHTTDERGRINSSFLKTGDIYGEEIINTTSSSNLLVTKGIVKSVTRVGAFALLAKDLNQLRTTSVPWKLWKNVPGQKHECKYVILIGFQIHPSHFYYC